MMYDLLIFDFDGTLVNTEPGIIDCLKKTFIDLNISLDSNFTLKDFMGPPLLNSFSRYCHLNDKQAKEAVNYFRTYYNNTGVYNSTLYNNETNVLKEFKKTKEICIASSKPEVFVRKLLQKFDILKYFTYIECAKPDSINTNKSNLIQNILVKYTNKNPIVIGDTKFDVLSAKQCFLPSIGVTYGYGTMNDFIENKPDYLVNSFTELLTLLK